MEQIDAILSLFSIGAFIWYIIYVIANYYADKILNNDEKLLKKHNEFIQYIQSLEVGHTTSDKFHEIFKHYTNLKKYMDKDQYIYETTYTATSCYEYDKYICTISTVNGFITKINIKNL